MRGSRPQRRIHPAVWVVVVLASLAGLYVLAKPSPPAPSPVGFPATPASHQGARPTSAAPSTSTSTKPSPLPTGLVGTGHCAGIHEPIVLFDEGHSWQTVKATDAGKLVDGATVTPAAQQLVTEDYYNPMETQEVFQIAQRAAKQLEADCYHIVSVKDLSDPGGWKATVSLLQRVKDAIQAHAALAISIHDDHSVPWGNGGLVFTQRDVLTGNPYDLYRQNENTATDVPTGPKVYLKDTIGPGYKKVADASYRYGVKITRALQAAEGRTVTLTDEDFRGRHLPATGTMPFVQLFSPVPWVYYDGGAGTGPLTTTEMNQTVAGLVAGVRAALPLPAP